MFISFFIAALTVVAGPGTQLRFGWGQYVQYPELQLLLAKAGSRSLLPERATHFLFSVEQRLGERTRVRAELYERERPRSSRQAVLRAAPHQRRRLQPSVERSHPQFRPRLRARLRSVRAKAFRQSALGMAVLLLRTHPDARWRGAHRLSADQDQRHTVNIFEAGACVPRSI